MEILKNRQIIILHGLKYEVHPSCFIHGHDCSNDEIFYKLQIGNKHDFIEQIVGYRPSQGTFPQLASLEDLTKVVEALHNYGKKPEEFEPIPNNNHMFSGQREIKTEIYF